jgi:hypothetical protein
MIALFIAFEKWFFQQIESFGDMSEGNRLKCINGIRIKTDAA